MTRRSVLAAVFALASMAAVASADESYHLPLGGPAPKVETEAQLRAFLDEYEAQLLLVYEGTSLEGYYQWRGYEPHYVAPFSRFANDLRNAATTPPSSTPGRAASPTPRSRGDSSSCRRASSRRAPSPTR